MSWPFNCEAVEHEGPRSCPGIERVEERMEWRTPGGNRRLHTVSTAVICQTCAGRRAEAWRRAKKEERGLILEPWFALRETPESEPEPALFDGGLP